MGKKQVKDEIRARLTIHGMGEMSTKDYTFLRKWVRMLADEIAREKQEVFSKRFRATLYKSDMK